MPSEARIAAPVRREAPPGSVSVVIPAHNGEPYIGWTLESLARQSYPDFECLVIDDGSVDRTAAVVERFASEARFSLRLVRHSENWGLARTLNHGLRETRGSLVLVLHQDTSLGDGGWLGRAVARMAQSRDVAVVTGNYGIPARGEVDLVQRTFGVLRRQFHRAPRGGLEPLTFSEFKCDLVRRTDIESVGGFPERFRVAGEDIWGSCLLRANGRRLLKDYELTAVQRFTGDATSVRGNLRKEFIFGRAIAGPLLRFRSALARDLSHTPYSRSRSWNRASQPFVTLALALLALVWILTHDAWFLAGALGLIGARLVYYFLRLYPTFRAFGAGGWRASVESVAGSALGFLSDFAYSAGLSLGLVSWARGRPI